MANIPNSPNPSLPHYIPIDKDGNALLQSPPIDTVYKDLEAIYALAKRYPQLISRLRALDYDSQKSLLDVIDAELDIAELNKVAIDHLTHEAKNPVKIQQQENDLIKKEKQPNELLKNKATTFNQFDKDNQPLKTCNPPELGIAQAVSGITGPQSTDRISSPNTPIPSTLPSPHLIKQLDVKINKVPPVNVNIHKESPPQTMSTPPPFTWVEENEEDEKFETPNETFPSIPAQVKPIAFIEQSLTQELIPPAPEFHTNEENNSLNDEDQQGSAKNSNTKATNPPLPLENLKSKKRKKKAVKCKEKSQPEPEKPSEQSPNSLVPVSNSKRQKKNYQIQAAESNDLAPPPPASHSNLSKADSAPQVPKPKQTLRQPKKKNGPIAPTRSSSRIKRGLATPLKDASTDQPPPIYSDLDAPRTDEPAKELISGLHQQEASQDNNKKEEKK
ncbi:hypothetical protein DFH28DRAFT_921596 [Melampsora americana]|nr:hypothetical protein DFH28DRAFT_921596 [Melampsora americana]